MDFWHRYFYAPNAAQKALSTCLLPISAIYGAIASCKRALGRLRYQGFSCLGFGRFGGDFGLPIISIGNLIAGGSGKTPFIIALGKYLDNFDYSHIIIISRGYKRQSKGLVWVSYKGELKANVAQSGDEPYLIALSLAHIKASVIVCKNRARAIKEAKKHGAQIILLDDAFRFGFSKFDVLLRPKREPFFARMLPSGIYRESPSIYDALLDSSDALVLKDGVDFVRRVDIENPTPKMLLITAIANPSRLDEFLRAFVEDGAESGLDSALESGAESSLDSGVDSRLDSGAQNSAKSSPESARKKPYKLIGKAIFSDHHTFAREEIEALLAHYQPSSILTTQKDATKLGGFPLSVMNLSLEIAPHALESMRHFIDKKLGVSAQKVIYKLGGRVFGFGGSIGASVWNAYLSHLADAWSHEFLSENFWQGDEARSENEAHNENQTRNKNEARTSARALQGRFGKPLSSAPKHEIFTPNDALELFISIVGEDSELEILLFIEYAIMSSIASENLAPNTAQSPESAPNNYDMSVPISALWLPMPKPSAHHAGANRTNHTYRSAKEPSYKALNYAQEALTMLGALFVNGTIDFYLENGNLNGAQSLGESFVDKEVSWKYVREWLLNALENASLYRRYRQILALPESSAPDYASHAAAAISATDAAASDVDSAPLTWDTPHLWNLHTLKIAHTKKGAQYFTTILAPHFFETYQNTAAQMPQ
ncbi:hypothetical protein BKN38_08365 [Helicobacter sp. CLO-3]|uniref:tetraacyldisaccharide 4'-kinase n=1 Tax=unclassified Helicobacter TaxID=2593540 RepID=UPI0008050FC9|nr:MULTISPECIES: tetraacyldisaccharide 4'-kinase [unclassified Helicobacter]OBV29911.1 hypothetical protein BA723_03555 [Helicobacter sp. CLO-3]OHU81756.1 hypothetical protein BKN38_08365 [Helicobacter sp. CLO-3]